MVGLGLGEDAKGSSALFNLCLLGCQSLLETLLQKLHSAIVCFIINTTFAGRPTLQVLHGSLLNYISLTHSL